MKPDPADPDGATARRRREPVCDAFEDAWRTGGRSRIEDVLGAEPELTRGALFRDLLHIELAYRRKRGESPVAEDYRERFPEHAAVVADLFAQTSAVTPSKSDARSSARGSKRAISSPTATGS